ncbi:MAG: hypothetical protein UZ16_OP3001002252, partial [Candidatus Hinthialibacteria bacterium OLB16]
RWPFRKTGDLPGHIMLCPYRKRVISLGTSCCAPTENGSSPFVIPDPATRPFPTPNPSFPLSWEWRQHHPGGTAKPCHWSLRSGLLQHLWPTKTISQPARDCSPRRLISACASHRLPYLGSLSSIPCAAVSRHDLSGAGIFCFFFPHSQ